MIRKLRGRFGISAPQVAVRTHVPWYFRAITVLGLLGLVVGLGIWMFDAGRRVAGFNQDEAVRLADKLQLDNRALAEEVVRLGSLLTASEGNVQIEQAAQKLLAEKNALLAAENARLKEDLAVFDKISRLEGKVSDEISLDQLNIRHEAHGLYRYSFLIALQGGRRGRESRFDLQVVAMPRTESQGAMMVFDRTEDAGSGQFEIVLRNFRRIDGKFQVPKGYPLGKVEVRILEKGKLKARKQVAVEEVSNVQ